METGYRVALSDCTSEFTEKKSRFISHLKCVHSEDEARKFIKEICAKYPDATHNCVAYRIMQPRIERFSDDGEPAGTAGMPMLEVMKKEDVYDVCVVVTRYFGGILLGGGGLIRAYGRGVSDALSKSGFALRVRSVTLELTYAYSGISAVDRYLENVSCNRINCDFSDNVRLTLSIAEAERQKFESEITDALNGSIKIKETDSGFDSFK